MSMFLNHFNASQSGGVGAATVVENLSQAPVSRRRFLQGMAAGGGLVLGLQLLPLERAEAHYRGAVSQSGPLLHPNIFLTINPEGQVTIIAHRSEMGQGIRTSLPQVLADELEADWNQVAVRQALGDAKYGSQYTDGSRSIRHNYQRFREFGATARQMLEMAAAEQWDVPMDRVRAENHRVLNLDTDESLGYGELVATAAKMPIPPKDTLRLKAPEEFRYIGKDIPIIDLPDMVSGKAEYSIDIRLPGMKYASVEHCPVTYGKVVSYDASEAMQVPGVEAVVELPQNQPPINFNTLGGIAVVASNTWAASEGRKKLKIEWDPGANASYDSGQFREALQETARQPGRIVREEGDIQQALKDAAQVVEAELYVPHMAHATMEPPSAVARFERGRCEVWSACQDPQAARATVSGALGIPEEDVISHVPLLGGAFGRKSKPDFAAEAALISREVGAPVKVTWSREDDLKHGYYHSVSAQNIKVGLDGNGKATAWHARSVFPTIWSTFQAGAEEASDLEMSLGFLDLPYDIPNVCLENGKASAHVRIGWLRSVCNIYHAFATNTMTHMMAQAAGRDHLDYLLELIGPDRVVDLSHTKYWNYDQTYEEYPIMTGRLKAVLQLAAEQSGYGKDLPAREAIGLAVHRSFVTYVATAVHARVSEDGRVSVPRVDVAVDAGRVVNPDRVRSQMEGATIYGMSAACYNEISAQQGRVQQSNFHDYRVVRMADGPREIHVHIVENDHPPGGVGEPGTPTFPPALTNAIFAATGKRILSLPITGHDLSA